MIGHTSLFSKILMGLYLCFLGYLCFSTSSMLPSTPSFLRFEGADKLVHYLMFLPFPWLFLLVLARGPFRPCTQDIVSIICFGVVLAGVTELIQLPLPARDCSFPDFCFDLLSIAVNTFLVYLLPPRSKFFWNCLWK